MEIKTLNKNNQAISFSVTVKGKAWTEMCDAAKAKLEAAPAKEHSCDCHDCGCDKDEGEKAPVTEDAIFDTAIRDLEPILYQEINSYEEYLKHKDQCLEWPLIDVKECNKDGLVMEIAFDFMPEVTLPNFDELKLDQKHPIVVDDKDVDAELQTLIDRSKKLVPITEDRALVNGDIANINFVGKVDGEEFQGGSSNDYDLTIGSNSFIPGFEDQLIGMKKGETKDVKVTFPEDYHADNLASKEAVFTVTLNSIKHEEVPVLNDDFVKSIELPDVKTVAELKTFIAQFLKRQKENDQDAKIQNQVMDFLSTSGLSFEPNAFKTKMIAQLKQQQFGQLAQYGISMDQYLEMMGEDKEKILADLERQAQQQMHITLALAQLVKDSKLEVTDQDLADEIKSIAQQFNVPADVVEKQIPSKVLVSTIKSRKIIDNIIATNQAHAKNLFLS